MNEIREFTSYGEMKDAHQKDVNDFPMVFMFGKKSDEELKRILAKINATSLDECISVYGAGDVMNKADLPKWNELCKVHGEERKRFVENNLVQAILYEMENHEYSYTRDPEDTLMALGRTYEDLENDPLFNEAWAKAQKKCFNWCDEED